MQPRVIESGVFPDPAFIAGYVFERLGQVFVERVLWSGEVGEEILGETVIRAPGYVWYRFWLPSYDQVIERYYGADGAPAGMRMDLCTPLVCEAPTLGTAACSATDLLMDIWIDPTGQVTVFNEDAFEDVVRRGEIDAERAQWADTHLRELTSAIARGRFPPPLVRNWQVDQAQSTRGVG